MAVGLLVVVVLAQALHEHVVLMVAAYLVLVFLIYTFCELLPKMLFRSLPNRLTLMLAGPFRSIHAVLSPLVWVMSRLADGLLHWTRGKTFRGHLFGSREEMRLVMQESAQGLTTQERHMINLVLDLQEPHGARRDHSDAERGDTGGGDADGRSTGEAGAGPEAVTVPGVADGGQRAEDRGDRQPADGIV